MATVLHTMTLGHQQNKMYGMIQQNSPQQGNCVIVSSGLTPAAKTALQGKRPLAPAPERSSVLVNNNGGSGGDLRCKRKIQFMPYGTPPQQPASVARRNARERNRVKQVNNGFATLRQHIPPSIAAAFSPSNSGSGRGASKKLSKVETLRLAVEYIRSLQQMIDDHENDSSVGSNASSDHNILENRYYSNSPDSLTQFTSYPILLSTPACSEASASPTPSHSSEGSMSTATTYTSNIIFHQDNYENYDPKSPEDEELLDAIFSWQQE